MVVFKSLMTRISVYSLKFKISPTQSVACFAPLYELLLTVYIFSMHRRSVNPMV